MLDTLLSTIINSWYNTGFIFSKAYLYSISHWNYHIISHLFHSEYQSATISHTLVQFVMKQVTYSNTIVV